MILGSGFAIAQAAEVNIRETQSMRRGANLYYLSTKF